MKSTLFYLFLFSFLFVACDDDDITAPPVDLYNVDIGSYELLEESLAAYPYTDKTGVLFVDSLGNEMTLTINDLPVFNSSSPATLFRYNVYDQGDTVRYEYFPESKSSQLVNESLDLNLRTSLTTQPYYSDPESMTVADVVNVSINEKGNTFRSFVVFTHVFDQRSWPEENTITENIESIEFFGREFMNVWHTPFNDTYSPVHFNYEFGIVYFTDHEGKGWRFDKFIE